MFKKGYETHFDTSKEKRLWLGKFQYDIKSEPLQFFETQRTYLTTPISVIELKVESNWGNKEYTCIYKFRVHGKIFAKDSSTSNGDQAKVDEL